MMSLRKPFDKLRANGNSMIPFVLSLSKHERSILAQRIPKWFWCIALHMDTLRAI
ncbi:MAG: hypothetical protein ACOH1I_10755 [Gallionellaceae bacterium]